MMVNWAACSDRKQELGYRHREKTAAPATTRRPGTGAAPRLPRAMPHGGHRAPGTTVPLPPRGKSTRRSRVSPHLLTPALSRGSRGLARGWGFTTRPGQQQALWPSPAWRVIHLLRPGGPPLSARLPWDVPPPMASEGDIQSLWTGDGVTMYYQLHGYTRRVYKGISVEV
jgi:hypothetical protein